jgi:hypothetical protein
MPYKITAKNGDKHSKNNKTQNKPVITIFTRNKMTSTEAQTQRMTKEHKTTSVRSIQAGVSYIRNQGDIKKVYILRDSTNKMINSYSFVYNKWATINMGGYLGGYKIGNPKSRCSCGAGGCDDPAHPICNLTIK